MRLSNLFYRSPRLLVLFLALIAVSGLAALQLLPRAEDPELTSRNAQIYVAFPGADADRVEALVTERIEDLLGEFEEIKEIKSYARPGLSTTAIELSSPTMWRPSGLRVDPSVEPSSTVSRRLTVPLLIWAYRSRSSAPST